MIEATPVIETYKPFPRQAEFHVCPAKYRLFGGQAGPGKSTALMWEAVMQALENPGADTLLLRRTYPELEKSIILPFRRDVPWQDLGARFNESKHIVYWPNGSTTQFGYSQNEKDVEQYQGGEYLFIGVDELTMFTMYQWQFLSSRNRCRVPGSRPNMAGATNPGNIGHAWVKALWIDKRPPAGMERADKYNPADYAFIRATLEDNPVYANDANYIATLEALPTHLYRAFRLGDWNVFAGQYYDNFSRDRHVKPAKAIELKPWFYLWISCDAGYAHPLCLHFHAQDGKRTKTYREIWGSYIGEKELAKLIFEAKGDDKISSFFLSPDAFAKRGDANSWATQIGEALQELNRIEIANAVAERRPARTVPMPSPASTDRIGGARLLYGMLQNDLWEISDACPRLIDCLPTLIHDEDNIEDVLKVDHSEGNLGDDPYDSARYGLYSHLGAAQKPLAERITERVATFAESRGQEIEDLDPTTIAHLGRRAKLLEKKKGIHTRHGRVWHPPTR